MEEYKKQMYKYRIFGLNVLSELELNCYKGVFDNSDVIIRYTNERQTIDLWLLDKMDEVNTFVASDELIYYVFGGKEIYILQVGKEDMSIALLFLLGSAFSIIFMQRNIFTIHGSSVMINNKSVTLVGDSGAGKSTLAAGFVEKGAKIITDDVSRIDSLESSPFVHPSYPSQKLWKNSADKLNINIDNATKIHNRYDKYYIEDTERFTEDIFPLAAIIEIKPSQCENVSIEKVNNLEALTILIKNTYRFEIIQKFSKTQEHLKFISNLSRVIPVYRLHRPENMFTIDQQVQNIINMCLPE